MKRIMLAACIVSLAACGGDKDDVASGQREEWEAAKASLVYSFPDNQQQQVPVPSPVVLRFSSPVVETAPAIVVREVGGSVINDIELEWVDGKRGLILTPDDKLKPLTEYVVQIPAVELEKGTALARDLRFTTRGLYEGPKSQVASDTFEVTRMIPDGENLPVMDFSSFRIQFSQPLDQSTVKYGDSADATVQLIGPGGLVDAHLLVSGHYMTVDPKEDLTPGAGYSLNLTTGITSIYGETLPGGSFGNPGDTLAVSLKANPKDTTSPTTGKRVAMVQDIADTGELSPLTGMPINLVPMASVLLGEDTATQASGTLAAELAFVPNFPDQTPFRVKRGSLIEGASIEVLIGGEVPAGFESGKVRMDFLSDATGYLLPNPYSNMDDAPRQVRLFMDVGVSTENPKANGAITQNLLHIELVGTSIVENGVMVINAVGVVEPDVLGAERAVGILSFFMKAFEDQDAPPSIAVDMTPPDVVSWFPGYQAKNFNTSDPVIVTFNKPISLDDTARELIRLEENGIPVDIDIYVRGSSIIIDPRNEIKRSKQSDIDINLVENYVYNLIIEPGLEDILGNKITQQINYQFEMPLEVKRVDVYEWPNIDPGGAWPVKTYIGEQDVAVRAPMVLAMYPGFPCALDESTLDLANDIVGRCKGMLDQIYHRTTYEFETDEDGEFVLDSNGFYVAIPEFRLPHKLPDDLIPLQEMPSNRPIVVIFSKNIMEESVKLGGSFSIVKVDEGGVEIEEVDGEIALEGKKITFYPEDPWQVGEIYSYTLGSNNDRYSGAANCDGTQAICDTDGYPIQTQLYSVTISSALEPTSMELFDVMMQDSNAATGGGPSMTQFFRATDSTSKVLQLLNAPSSDLNANMVHESNKPFNEMTTFKMIKGPYGEYVISEPGAEGQPVEEGACVDGEPGCIDPGGLVPPANSAKLMVVDEFLFQDSTDITSVNIGCGYDTFAFDPVTPFKKTACPENKFTYITSSLVAEVAEFDPILNGIPVSIWPGQIMSTALEMYNTQISIGYGVNGTNSGPQVMRMRYAKQDAACVEDPATMSTCLRNKPIEGIIYEVNGKPYISSEVEVYVDAIDLENRLEEIGNAIGLINSEIFSDLYSVPITLNLEGEVIFNDDGTMQISMVNLNTIDMPFNLKLRFMGMPGAPLGDLTLRLPATGANMQYFSEIIK